MRIVFSLDRPAQLDLLLRSLERYAPEEETVVIYRVTTSDFLTGYAVCQSDHPAVSFRRETQAVPFDARLDEALPDAGETVSFFCDDDVLYRPIDDAPGRVLESDEDTLTFSLRLGFAGTKHGVSFRSTSNRDSPYWWDWTTLLPHDHGYPGSIDGHTFRTTDVLRMIKGQAIPNPLILETVLAQRVSALAAERPLMACYREQCLVGVDVNKVAEARAGAMPRWLNQTAQELNRRFLGGERISLDALDFSGVDGCLVELPFQWERPA